MRKILRYTIICLHAILFGNINMVSADSELTPRYPSDLSDEEWEILKQLLMELDPYTRGRPRKSEQREILRDCLGTNLSHKFN